MKLYCNTLYFNMNHWPHHRKQAIQHRLCQIAHSYTVNSSEVGMKNTNWNFRRNLRNYPDWNLARTLVKIAIWSIIISSGQNNKCMPHLKAIALRAQCPLSSSMSIVTLLTWVEERHLTVQFINCTKCKSHVYFHTFSPALPCLQDMTKAIQRQYG